MLLMIYNPALWLCLTATFGRLSLAYNSVALPLLAAAPLLASRCICNRVLEAVAVEGPLASLFHWVSLAQ